MVSYCLKYRDNARVPKTNKGELVTLSKCTVCNTKKSRFVKEQGASELLTSLGLKEPLSKITLVGLILF